MPGNVCVSSVVRFRSRVLSPTQSVERRYKLWITPHRTIEQTFCWWLPNCPTLNSVNGPTVKHVVIDNPSHLVPTFIETTNNVNVNPSLVSRLK